MKKLFAILCVYLFWVSSVGAENRESCDYQSPVEVNLNGSGTRQLIDGFGASDAWSMQYLGLWPEQKRKKIAEWLFSTENDHHGNPEGIGLSIWRFNMGAGSAYQGDKSGIGSVWTRTESFLMPDGKYDWDKQLGQRRFLKMAKSYGVRTFVAFLNSPNVLFTANGLATNTGRGGNMNLKSDQYGAFVKDIANVLVGVERHDGIHFSYVSPVNEPDGQWNWLGPKQEGSPATNREVAKVVRLLGKELSHRGITTKIILPEASDYRCMYQVHEAGWQRGNEIQSFFSPDSVETYIGNVPNVCGLMAAHSYWTTTPPSNLRNIRKTLRDSLNRYHVHGWQSEVCIMSNDEEIGGGGGFDFTMKTALYVARIIHHDLVFGDMQSWQWWRAAGGDYKDGLIRFYEDSTFCNGTFRDSKLMWAFGNYSRFIRPGAVRLGYSYTEPDGLMISSYCNKDKSNVIVVINYSAFNRKMIIKGMNKWKRYITSDSSFDNLRCSGSLSSGHVEIIPSRSIVTYVSF